MAIGKFTDGKLRAGHAILHFWWNNPSKTDKTKKDIFKKHADVVKEMKKRGIKHNSPLR